MAASTVSKRSMNLENAICPPELSDYIIDFLWNDCRALAKCSTICRDWVPTVRLHMFQSVMLWGEKRYKRFYALLDNSFSAGVAPYVRSLLVSVECIESMRRRRESLVFLVYLRRILAMLTNVERLVLFRSDLVKISLSPETYHALLDSFCESTFSAKLTALSLDGVHLTSFCDLQRLVTAYPGLSRLHVVNPIWSESQCEPSAAPSDSGEIKLDELTIRTDSAHDGRLYSLVSSTPFELRLRKLGWQGSEKELPAVRSLLQRSAPFLERFHLALTQYHDGEMQDLPELSACARLVSVRLASTFLGGHPGLPMLLWRLRSPHLQELIFDYCTDFGRDWAGPWENDCIDESLARLVRDLPRVSVVFLFRTYSLGETRQSWGASVVRSIVRTLPLSCGAGMKPTVRILYDQDDWSCGMRPVE